MGAGQSSEALPTMGYHIQKVQPNSPGEKAGLVAYFDFLVAVAGVPLSQESSLLPDTLQAHVNQEVKLTVYSMRNKQMRECTVVPTTTWGGSGLLGCNVQFQTIENAQLNVWHILTVFPNSPAAEAGLEAEFDYIFGSADAVLAAQDDLNELAKLKMGRQMRVYVYSSRTCCTREVTVIPSTTWGGRGSLGAEVGYGLLHQIPVSPVVTELAERPVKEEKPDDTHLPFTAAVVTPVYGVYPGDAAVTKPSPPQQQQTPALTPAITTDKVAVALQPPPSAAPEPTTEAVVENAPPKTESAPQEIEQLPPSVFSLPLQPVQVVTFSPPAVATTPVASVQPVERKEEQVTRQPAPAGLPQPTHTSPTQPSPPVTATLPKPVPTLAPAPEPVKQQSPPLVEEETADSIEKELARLQAEEERLKAMLSNSRAKQNK